GDLAPLALRAGDGALRDFYCSHRLGNWPRVEAMAGAETPGPDDAPCRAGRDVAGINPQGLVSACQTIPLYGGDLRRAPFREIWNDSAEIRKVRQLTWGRIEECNVCDVRRYCVRCHSMAYLEDGKIDGPSREACRHAVLLRDLLRERGLIPAGETALPPPLARRRVRLRVV